MVGPALNFAGVMLVKLADYPLGSFLVDQKACYLECHQMHHQALVAGVLAMAPALRPGHVAELELPASCPASNPLSQV